MSHSNRKRVVVSRADVRRGVNRKSPNVISHYVPRLIIDANCATCGHVEPSGSDPTSVPKLAVQHTAATGHVVILNGTVDAPENEWRP